MAPDALVHLTLWPFKPYWTDTFHTPIVRNRARFRIHAVMVANIVLAPVSCVLGQAGTEGLVARSDAAGAPVLAEALAHRLVAARPCKAQRAAAGRPTKE